MSPRTPSLALTLLPLLALSVPRHAAAQSITVDISGNSSVSVKSSDCSISLTVNWTATGVASVSPCSELTAWVTTAATCASPAPTANSSTDRLLGTVAQATWPTQASGSFPLRVDQLPIFFGGACPVANLEQTMKVCASAKYNSTFGGSCGSSSDVELKPSSPPTILYDTKAPAAPTITAVGSLDGALLISFDAPSDALQVIPFYTPDSATMSFVDGTPGPASSGSIRLGGLTNGIQYEVLLRAEDAAGNQSGPSGSKFGTPEQSYGFFANYQKAHGAETGGCAAAPAGALPLLALAWARRSRRRHSRGELRP